MARFENLRSFWDRYWFSPGPVVDLDFLRIAAVSIQLLAIRGAWWWHGPIREHLAFVDAYPDFFYKPIGVIDAYSALAGGARPSLTFVLAIYWLTCGAGTFALVGLFTRFAMPIFAAGSLFIVSFYYSFSDYHHPEALLLITLLILSAAPVGRTLSVDALRARMRRNLSTRSFVAWDQVKETHEFAGWPVRLVRVLFAMTYLSAALAKLNLGKGGSFLWTNGSTLQYYMVQDAIRFSSPVAIWFTELPVELISLFSWGALAFEGTFCLVLMWPRLAALYVPAGIGFHLGIYITQRAAFFQTIILYVCFLPVQRVVLALRARIESEKLMVLYDAECFLCIRSMTVLQFLDWFDRIDYVRLQDDPIPRLGSVDAAFRRRALEEMHVVEPEGGIHAGYSAFRRLTWKLPLLWPLLLFLYLPGAKVVGGILYRFVATTRRRVETCESDACPIHPPR